MPVFTERAAAALAAQADANFVTHASWVQRQTSGMSVRDGRGLVVVDSGLPCDTFNFVCRSRLTAREARMRVRTTVEGFRRAGRPFSWWVGPADRPLHLRDLLREAGLVEAETELAMAVDLDRLRVPPEAPEGLRVARVVTARDLEAFARVAAANWSPPDPQVLRFYELAAPVLLRPEAPLWLYVGRLRDEVVATSELTVGGGIAGLYNISTLEGHRRRGIGTAMTLQPLTDGRAAGHRTAVLQAAPDGVGIYRRVGFAAFGEITEYKPPARVAVADGSAGRAARQSPPGGPVEVGEPGERRPRRTGTGG